MWGDLHAISHDTALLKFSGSKLFKHWTYEKRVDSTYWLAIGSVKLKQIPGIFIHLRDINTFSNTFYMSCAIYKEKNCVEVIGLQVHVRLCRTWLSLCFFMDYVRVYSFLTNNLHSCLLISCPSPIAKASERESEG